MEYYLNKIGEIMQPYYKFEEEFIGSEYEKELKSLHEARDIEIKSLTSRLQRLREEKNKSISEFGLLYPNRPDAARRDLEMEYKYKEEELIFKLDEIKKLPDLLGSKENFIKVYRERMSELNSQIEKIEEWQKNRTITDDKLDLEKLYLKGRLKTQLNILSEIFSNGMAELNLKESLDLVNNKETMIEKGYLKDELRIPLIRMKNIIEKQIQSIKFDKYKIEEDKKSINDEILLEQKKFNEIIQQIQQFNLDYNEDNKIKLASLRKKLDESIDKINKLKNSYSSGLQSSEIDKKINDLELCLDYINENLDVLKKTKEEIYYGMYPKSKEEIEKYQKRVADRINKFYDIETLLSSLSISDEEDLVLPQYKDGYLDLSDLPRTKDLVLPETIGNPELPDLNKNDIIVDNESQNNDDNLVDKQQNAETDDTKLDSLDPKFPSDLIDSSEPVDLRFSASNGKILVDGVDELCNIIFSDIVDAVENMKSIKVDGSTKEEMNDERYFSDKIDSKTGYNLEGTIKLGDRMEQIELPNGEYFNLDDMNMALDNFKTRNRNNSYIVKDVNKEFSVSESKIDKIKRNLKKCISIGLMSENKTGLKKVYGTDKSRRGYVGLGTINTTLPQGDYISKTEFRAVLKDVIVPKKHEWVKKFIEFLRGKDDELDDDLLDVDLLEKDIKLHK